jgi:DNA modification methylase
MQLIRISELKRAEYNPRIMPDSEMQALVTSIETKGFVEPIVVNSSKDRYGTIIGGHQRLSAIERLISRGITPRNIEKEGDEYLIPVMFAELDNFIEEVELNLALNKIHGNFDEEKLYTLIVNIKESPTLPSSGFREDEISRILDQTLKDDEKEEEPIDETAEARSKIGEIYELGQHRLICGDSTDPEVYKALLGKEKADMIFTDPPYNVNYHSRGEKLKNDELEKIKNDNMTPEEFKAFIDGAFSGMITCIKEGGSLYICSGWSSYPQFLDSMLKNGFRHSGVIIWVKNVPSMGWNDYRYKHEWIAKAKKPDPKTAESIIYGWKVGTHSFFGDNEYDVWEMPRKATARYLHPTEKPDWLCMRALRNSTKRNDIVLDPFAGSGSTMTAAEKVGRRAFMIELDPKFCDVIRDRWERVNRANTHEIL